MGAFASSEQQLPILLPRAALQVLLAHGCDPRATVKLRDGSSRSLLRYCVDSNSTMWSSAFGYSEEHRRTVGGWVGGAWR